MTVFETTVEETGGLTSGSISQILIETNSGKFVITIKKLIQHDYWTLGWFIVVFV
jgi:hypothetical protein